MKRSQLHTLTIVHVACSTCTCESICSIIIIIFITMAPVKLLDCILKLATCGLVIGSSQDIADGQPQDQLVDDFGLHTCAEHPNQGMPAQAKL